MRNHVGRGVVVLLGAMCCWAGTTPAPAADRYYLMIFAAEGRPNLPRLAHTFATFIKVKQEKGVAPAKQSLEAHTISWLPATLDVRLLHAPEKGVNLDLAATLKHEFSQGAAVYAWGPFEIKKDLYDDALRQIARLKSGKVLYKALDGELRPDGTTNCFHAVSDIVPGPLLETGTAYGQPASQMVLQHLAPWLVSPPRLQRELAARLVSKDAAIVWRNDLPAVPKKDERKGSPTK